MFVVDADNYARSLTANLKDCRLSVGRQKSQDTRAQEAARRRQRVDSAGYSSRDALLQLLRARVAPTRRVIAACTMGEWPLKRHEGAAADNKVARARCASRVASASAASYRRLRARRALLPQQKTRALAARRRVKGGGADRRRRRAIKRPDTIIFVPPRSRVSR